MYAYAYNTSLLSLFKLSPYQIVFHTHPRIPFTFSLNLPQLLGKAISYEFMNQQSSGSFSDNPYRSPRIGLHDYMLNLTPLLIGSPMLFKTF